MSQYINIRYSFAILCIFVSSGFLDAQHFGRNKVVYNDFDFKVLETPGFDIYYYTKNEDKIMKMAEWAENWMKIHQAVLLDTIEDRNP
ncbi:hypothetical protein RZS08_50620, partial [Arthrospira platensis SPKY1]|nr:hypothetical protein [Arthrospira platensis SPKY1]